MALRIAPLLLAALSAYLMMMGPLVKAEVRPGFKARISQVGLNYLRDTGLAILKEEIKQLTFPDISGQAHVPVVGNIYYTISNMRITSFTIQSATLDTKSGVGLALQANGITLSVSGNWHYNNHGFIHISDSGTFDASLSDAFLALTLQIGKDQAGRPTVSSTSSDCSFNAGSVRVKLHGGASWLYNLFSGKISNAIKDSLNKRTCSMIINEVNTDLQKQFSNLKTQAPLDQYAVIDYSLLSPPDFSGLIDMAIKGEVFPRDAPHKEAPYTAPVIPADPDVSRHVFFWVTDYLFETAAYVYYEAGRFEFNVTQAKLPPGKFSLNTSFLVSSMMPDVTKKYPNMLMQVNAAATAPPAVAIGVHHVNASLLVDLDFFVTLPNKTLVYLFTLNSTINGSTLLSCDGSSLKWESPSLSIAVALKRSDIGNIQIKPISEAVNFLISFYLMPWINEKGQKGFPLPTSPNIKLEKPVFKQGKGFIKLGADIQFTPSALLF